MVSNVFPFACGTLVHPLFVMCLPVQVLCPLVKRSVYLFLTGWFVGLIFSGYKCLARYMH